jgi:hypothetical protein
VNDKETKAAGRTGNGKPNSIQRCPQYDDAMRNERIIAKALCWPHCSGNVLCAVLVNRESRVAPISEEWQLTDTNSGSASALCICLQSALSGV